MDFRKMDEQKQKVFVSGLHALAAIPVGWFSLAFSQAYGQQITLLLGLVILAFLFYLTETMLKKGYKWWLANGLFMYLFVWAVSWIYFANV